MSGEVDRWRAGLAPTERDAIDRLRGIVMAAAPDLAETIKWNAPSYHDGTDHKVTLGIERKGGFRIVLHRGVGRRDSTAFVFDGDPASLATWPSPDRGIVTLRDPAAIAAAAGELHDLIASWVATTRSSA